MPPSDQDIRNRLLVARLPALPHILLKLMEYCRTEEVGMLELAELIAKDPAIATKILSVANSSAYHRGGEKIRLEHSLMSLGTEMIRMLVISESVFQALNGFTSSNSTNLCSFWRHSLTAAVIARDLAKKMNYLNVDEAYLGGLLHNVGRLAFLAISPNEYSQHFHAVDDEDLCAIEQRTMQITHAEAGAWLLDRWKLDSFLADSVLYHHESVSRLESAHPLVRIVFLAHQLASHSCLDPVIGQTATICGLHIRDLETIQNDAEKKVIESAKFLGIDLTGADKVPPVIPHVQPPPAQRKLNEEMHHIVQASETKRIFEKQTSESELLKTVIQSAHILFNLEGATVLMLDAASRTLIGIQNDKYRQRLSEFSLPLVRSSVVAESLTKKHPTFISSKHHPLGIADEQLFRIFDSEWLVCLPLQTEEKCLGTIVCSSSLFQMAALHRNAGFLQDFANQAAAALHTLRNKKATVSEAEKFRLSSRKVAHEINNPLSIIKNYLNLLNAKLAKSEPVSREISVVSDEIDRVSRIIQEFADPQPATFSATSDVNRIVLDVIRLLRETGFASKSVNIRTLTEGRPSETSCDDGAIRQILMNLLKNSIEAMPDGGEIQITNNGHVTHNGRSYISLSIKDSGPGISKSVLERIFTPVASTKGISHQGLGLSIVQDLVKRSHGFIACQSSSSGALFNLMLPVQTRGGNTPGSELHR